MTGVFRRRWHPQPRRRVPFTAAAAGGTTIIGYNAIGALTDTAVIGFNPEANVAAATRYTGVAGDTITDVSVYGADTGTAEVALYQFSGGVPTTRVAGPVTVTIGATAGWYTTAVSWALNPGVDYCLAVDWFPTGGEAWTLYYDNAAAGSTSFDASQALPATWSEGGTFATLGSYRATVTHGGAAPPNDPTNINVVAGDALQTKAGAFISWKRGVGGTNPTGYEVEKRVNAGAWTAMPGVDTLNPDPEFSDATDLEHWCFPDMSAHTNGDSVEFRVRAVNASGESGWLTATAVVLGERLYPNSVSARQLLDQNGNAMTIIGDTPWSIAAQSREDILSYLDSLAATNANAFIASLPEPWYTPTNTVDPDGLLQYNAYTETPWSGGAPFQLAGTTTLNEAYWNHVDLIIRYAAVHGISVWAFPAYTGFGDDGYFDEVLAASDADLTAYGQALNTRYAADKNVLWAPGHDRASPTAALVDKYAFMFGVLGAATFTNHLIWAGGESSTPSMVHYWTDVQTWVAADFDINALYSYQAASGGQVAALVEDHLVDDLPAHTGPMVWMEGGYENSVIVTATQELLRHQLWASIAQGCFGHFFGHHRRWHFDSPQGPAGGVTWTASWTENGSVMALDTASSIIANLALPNLHDLLGDFDTQELVTNDGANRSGVRYLANTGAFIYARDTATFVVDLTVIGGTVDIFRIDPENGTRTSIATALDTTGQTAYTGMQGQGNNADAATDWLFEIVVTSTTLGQVVETDSPQALTAAKDRNLNQVTETDTPQPVAASKTRTLGLASETETPQPLTVRKSRALGQASETDTPQPVNAAKTRSLGQASETDTPQPLTTAKTRTLGQPTETETAFPITEDGGVALGLVVETDTAQPVAAAKSRALGLASETETVFGLTVVKARTLGQTPETDTPQPLTTAKTRALGLAAETDTALPVIARKSRALGQVVETDTAQPSTASKTRTLGQVVETDTPFPITEDGGVALGQAVESDTPQPLAAAKTRALGQAAETETPLPLTASKSRALGQAVETDAAQTLASAKSRVLGLTSETETPLPISESGGTTINIVVETDTAHPLTTAKTQAVGQATETETAFGLTARKSRTLGQAAETETPLPITEDGGVAIGQVVETDAAQTLAAAKSRTLGQAVETETVFGLTAVKSRALGQTAETDTPQPLVTAKSRTLGQAAEADTPFPITEDGGTTLGVAVETDTPLAVSAAKSRTLGQAVETETAFGLTVRKSRPLGGPIFETSVPFSLAAAKRRTIGVASEAELPLGFNVVIPGTVASVEITLSPPQASIELKNPTLTVGL